MDTPIPDTASPTSLYGTKNAKKKNCKKIAGNEVPQNRFFAKPHFFLLSPLFFSPFPNAPHVSDRRKKKFARNKHPACRFSCFLNSDSKFVLVLFFGVFLITFFRHRSFAVKYSFFCFVFCYNFRHPSDSPRNVAFVVAFRGRRRPRPLPSTPSYTPRSDVVPQYTR